MQANQLQNIIEAALLVAAKPMSVAQIESLFTDDGPVPSRDDIRQALVTLQESYEGRGIELTEVASGWRMQSRQEMSPWIANLFQEKAPRYSRALLETLVLIAYRQPITRGEIEDVRGVAVNSYIIKTLIERNWVKVVGHRDVPGRPELLATTREFLDYFNLRKIGDLPTLAEIKALEEIAPDLAKEVDMLEAGEASENDADQSEDQNDGAPSDPTLESAESTSNTDSAENQDGESLDPGTHEDIVVAGEDIDLAALDQPLSEADSQSAADAIDKASTVARVTTVDVELPPDEESAGELLSDKSADELEEELGVAEATIDALSHVTRSESELLH